MLFPFLPLVLHAKWGNMGRLPLGNGLFSVTMRLKTSRSSSKRPMEGKGGICQGGLGVLLGLHLQECTGWVGRGLVCQMSALPWSIVETSPG